jgi:hypothetical protein
MQCLRVYADDKGESHFSNLEIPMSEAPPPLSAGIQMSARMTTRDIRFLTIPAGSSTDWHPAPVRQFVISLDKTVEVEVSDGERRRVPPASVMLVEDTWGKGHRTRSLGDHAGTVIFVPLADDALR